MLQILKGSASMGTRQLVAWGAIRKVWIPGERRNYYEVVGDLRELMRGSYKNLIEPKVRSSKKRLEMLRLKLSEDFESGAIKLNQKEILEERINALVKIQNRLTKFLPIVEKILH